MSEAIKQSGVEIRKQEKVTFNVDVGYAAFAKIDTDGKFADTVDAS